MSVNITEISRELVFEGYTKRIDTKAYWDAHGKVIPWDGSKVFKYPEAKKYELYKITQLWESEFLKPAKFTMLELFVNGERLECVGEITQFTELKTKVKLDCCVGAG